MADTFRIVPYVVRSAGTDVPPEEVQAAINSLAQQTTIALNSVASDPTGPAGGDLSGTYPNPTVAAVHATSGTMSGVTINSSSVGQSTPAAGAFTTLTATTPVAATSGGTGRNALTANAVIIGEGSSAVNFAAPGASGTLLASNGVSADPTFQTSSSLGLAPLASPAFTGTPTAPTAAAHTNTTQLATTAFVETEFASPPTAGVGSVTPSPGAFTTLTATTPVGVASGGTGRATLANHGVLVGAATAAITQLAVGTTGQMLLGITGADPAFGNNPTITGGTIDGAAIGGSTPAAGAFTTLSSTGNFTPSQTNGIVGTTTNNNANAGSVGEFVTATSGAVGLTSGTPANVTSISLTAGDWDVWGNVMFQAAAATVLQTAQTGINTTSATIPAAPLNSVVTGLTFATNAQYSQIAPQQRLSLSTTTTVFLVCNSGFTTSTETATGYIAARRRR